MKKQDLIYRMNSIKLSAFGRFLFIVEDVLHFFFFIGLYIFSITFGLYLLFKTGTDFSVVYILLISSYFLVIFKMILPSLEYFFGNPYSSYKFSLVGIDLIDSIYELSEKNKLEFDEVLVYSSKLKQTVSRLLFLMKFKVLFSEQSRKKLTVVTRELLLVTSDMLKRLYETIERNNRKEIEKLTTAKIDINKLESTQLELMSIKELQLKRINLQAIEFQTLQEKLQVIKI